MGKPTLLRLVIMMIFDDVWPDNDDIRDGLTTLTQLILVVYPTFVMSPTLLRLVIRITILRLVIRITILQLVINC